MIKILYGSKNALFDLCWHARKLIRGYAHLEQDEKSYRLTFLLNTYRTAGLTNESGIGAVFRDEGSSVSPARFDHGFIVFLGSTRM